MHQGASESYHKEASMRITNDEFRAAVRAFFDTVPAERLRNLALMFLADPFVNPQRQPRRPGRPGRRRKAVEEGNVVPLHRKPRGRRRKPAVDEVKLAERRKRAAANRKARRHAAKAAATATAPVTTAASNGNGQGITPIASFWRHAQTLNPQAPWKPVMREFGTNEAAARHAFRTNALPPHVGPVAVERFLTLQA
jgi:hypothetical protein